MDSVFFIRYKRVVLWTFFIVLLLCFLLTLFTPPTYQSRAIVSFPSGSEPAAEIAVLDRMGKQLIDPPMENGKLIFPPASHVAVVITPSGQAAHSLSRLCALTPPLTAQTRLRPAMPSGVAVLI